MLFTSRRERHLWSAAGLCVALIYSSLAIARHVADALRERNLLRLTVVCIFLAVVGLIVWRLAVARPGRRVVATVTLIGAGYLALLTAVPMLPEERLHFIEYGVVAVLIYEALRERRTRLAQTSLPTARAGPSPFLTAVLVTGALGWIDEGIQILLPNRFYDLRDVAFNAMAGLLSLLALKLVEHAASSE